MAIRTKEVFGLKTLDEYATDEVINNLLSLLQEKALSHFYPDVTLRLFFDARGWITSYYIPFYSFGLFKSKVNTMDLFIKYGEDKSGQINLIKAMIRDGLSNYLNHIAGKTWKDSLAHFSSDFYREIKTGLMLYDDIPEEEFLFNVTNMINYPLCLTVPEEVSDDFVNHRLSQSHIVKYLMITDLIKPSHINILIPKSKRCLLSNNLAKCHPILQYDYKKWLDAMNKIMNSNKSSFNTRDILSSDGCVYGPELFKLFKAGILLDYFEE